MRSDVSLIVHPKCLTCDIGLLRTTTEPLKAGIFKGNGHAVLTEGVPGSRWVAAGDDAGDVARCSLKSFFSVTLLAKSSGKETD